MNDCLLVVKVVYTPVTCTRVGTT